MSKSRRLLILGATGYTGKIICQMLDEKNISFSIAARNEIKLQEFGKTLLSNPPVIAVDVLDKTAVIDLIKPFDLIVNCIGPFNVFGNLILETIADTDKIYLDITGEQHIVQDSFTRFADTKSTIAHSVSFESCLADVMASEVLDAGTEYEDISSFYFFQKTKPSPGTRLTMKLARNFPLYCVKSGRMVKALPMSFKREVLFNAPENLKSGYFMPYPEVLFFQRRYQVANSGSFLLMTDADGSMASHTQGSTPVPVETALEQHARINASGPSLIDRKNQEFFLAIQAIALDGSIITRSISGFDMYGITALLVVHVIQAWLSGVKFPTGVITPSELKVWENLWEDLVKGKYIQE